jgi:hypothetical protein
MRISVLVENRREAVTVRRERNAMRRLLRAVNPEPFLI